MRWGTNIPILSAWLVRRLVDRLTFEIPIVASTFIHLFTRPGFAAAERAWCNVLLGIGNRESRPRWWVDIAKALRENGWLVGWLFSSVR